MFKEKAFVKKLGLGLCVLASVSLLNGCDESYSLSGLEGDISLLKNGISAPVGNTEKFYLNDFIGENDFIKIDEDGRYMISYSGNASTSLSIPSLEVPAMQPNFASAHLDFFESIRNTPELQEIITLIETATGGEFDHYNSIPEIKNPITGENIPLNVNGIHALIPRSLEEFEMDIYDIPKELVGVSQIVMNDNATVELSLHAEGLPKTIDEISIDFYVHPPVQLHITPVDESIEVVREDYFHISHTLPCVDGKLDDLILFRLDRLEFKEPLEREEDGKIAIFADLDYEGRIDINQEFDLTGWTPVLDLNVGFKISEFSIKSACATVQADIEPISFSQEITGLPDLLASPNNCFDLSFLTFELNIDNATPATLGTGFMMQSTFQDGSESGEIAIKEPIIIEPNQRQQIIISNEEKYAGQPGYISNLNEIMYKIPRLLRLKASPYIPRTDVELNFNTEFNVGIDYSLSVPVVFGEDLYLSLSGDFGDLGADIASLTEHAIAVELTADIVNTLPLDVTMSIVPVDAEGNILKGITIEGIPLVIDGDATTPFDIKIKAVENNELDKLYTLQFEIKGAASSENNELRPDQYLQFTNIALSLPEGVSIKIK